MSLAPRFTRECMKAGLPACRPAGSPVTAKHVENHRARCVIDPSLLSRVHRTIAYRARPLRCPRKSPIFFHSLIIRHDSQRRNSARQKFSGRTGVEIQYIECVLVRSARHFCRTSLLLTLCCPPSPLPPFTPCSSLSQWVPAQRAACRRVASRASFLL